jgi:ATP-binding cassette subfamily C protein CydD
MFSRKLWTEARSEKISLFATILFGIILGGFIIGQAWLLSTIITSVFIHNQTLNDVRPYLSSLLLIIFGRGLSTYAREISSGRVSIWVRADLRRKLLHHLQQVSPIIVSFGRTGEITTAYIQGVDRLDAYFRKYLPQLFISAILPIMVLWVVFPIDWLTRLVLAVTAPLIPNY